MAGGLGSRFYLVRKHLRTNFDAAACAAFQAHYSTSCTCQLVCNLTCLVRGWNATHAGKGGVCATGSISHK